MKNLFYLIAIVAFLSPFTTTAQEMTRCAADEYHAEKMKNPEYAQKFRAIQRLVNEKSKLRSPSCDDPMILPVAVHWNGGITNANMQCLRDIIDNQIDILNEDFGGYNSDINNYCNHSANCPVEFAPNALGGGTCVQFCIATQNHPASANLNDGDYAMTFGQYNFPPQDQAEQEAPDWAGYVNFFVSDVSPPGYSNLLGLAPLAGGANPDGNGIFVTSNSFGGDNYSCTSGVLINGSGQYGLGRTATHEAGHYFSLPHVFTTSNQDEAEEPTPDPCPNDNDNISDTPLQYRANFGVHTVNYETCESDAHNTCGTQDFFFDFMDYGDDQVLYMFSSIQSDNINTTAAMASSSGNPYKVAATTCATLPQNYTPTFPDGCPAATPPNSAFTTTATAPFEFCPAMNEMSFTDMSTDFPTSWAWTFSGAGVVPTSSTDQNPTINVNSTGTLTVTLTASNNAGDDATPASMTYEIVIKEAADCGNCGESFFDTGGAGANYSNNEDMTWTLCAANPGEVVVVEFTSISVDDQAFKDRILVTEGVTPANSNAEADYIVMLQNVYKDNGGGSYGNVSNTLTSCESCMTFHFLSDASGTFPGWEANISCIPTVNCSDGIQNQEEVFVDCGNMDNGCEICNTCPTACEGFTFYDAGGASNPTGSDSQEWTICADETDEHVTLDFTTIDMQPFNNGILRVYEGETNNGNDYDYYISGTAIYIDNGGNLENTNSTMITSTGQCFTFVFFNGDDGNGWVANVTSDCALPISLSEFKGEIVDNDIQLSWETSSEINSEKFVLQRSAEDGIFRDINTIEACGNCTNTNLYTYLDRNVAKGINHTYRLKMVDRDGGFSYSSRLSFVLKSSTKDWNVFPNPGKGVFTLALAADHPYTKIKLIDKLGRLVYVETIDNQDHAVSLDFERIESGYYQLILIGNETTSKPIVILP